MKNAFVVLLSVLVVPPVFLAAQTRIAFIDVSLQRETPARTAAALAYARTQGDVTRICPAGDGGWKDAEGRLHAPEEFDVVWFHEADDLARLALGEAANTDLMAYLENGGALLLSGAAGVLLNQLNIEATPLRALGPTDAPYASGFRIVEKHRSHPAFKGFDPGPWIILTSKGGNALADFHATKGPHGDVLADANAGLGTCPLVEYTVGEGRVVFVGWRLPDFTTDQDPNRPNLERLFHNLLCYLSEQNRNRARVAEPSGPCQYVRTAGVPFLRAAKPQTWKLPAEGARFAVLLSAEKTGPDSVPVDGGFVRETPISTGEVSAAALAMTLCQREKPVSRFLALRRGEQDALDRQDCERIGALRIIKPDVRLLPAPLKPLKPMEVDQSVLLGHSAFMAPGEGTGDITPAYEPIEDGGFRISESSRRLNRPIVHGQNRVWTGDLPIFRMDTVTGNGSYARTERVFPLWPRPDAHIGGVNPCMGTLRLGARGADNAVQWLDDLKSVTAVFRPGYTEYQLENPTAGWKASVCVAPALDFHGMICRVEFDKDVALVWQYGGVWWQATEANANRAEIREREARITEPNLPDGLVLVGWDGEGAGRAVQAAYGQQVEFAGAKPRRVYHVAAAWGVTRYDEDRAAKTMARLDTPVAAAWPEKCDELKRLWFDCHIGRALKPEAHVQQLLASPEAELRRTRTWWDRRREEFQVRTPDPHLNALINWARCVSEYHRQGPGLVLGGQTWQMYAHISVGWYGKEWGGDHQAMEECLRFYAAMQADNGFIRWISPSLVAFRAENNTPYWVDQVWRHYTWTGDRQFLQDIWPVVRKAVACHQGENDPDGDGLFRDGYEYWNCDSNGKGPKSAAPTATGWAMFDRASRIASVLGDAKAEAEYRALAEKTCEAVFRELWKEEAGRLGSIGSDEIWRGHPQIWEEYLAINAGLLSPEQGRRAMRWVASHYGFEPQPGVRLLSCSDWWPIRWSVQWVPTGDTCLAALAGMRCGDADLWWPFLSTVVRSSFRSSFPGINMGISNAGAGGGDREDVDSDDPHIHAAVRGLFGIEPALHEGRLDICPAFPSDWREASIRTPDVAYEYRRDGDHATFRIRTPRPLVKRVRANLSGPETVTKAETESLVTVPVGPLPPPPAPPAQPTILVDAETPAAPNALPEQARKRLVLVDLARHCNVTVEEMAATKFTFDYRDSPQPLSSWWGNPILTMPSSPRAVETKTRVLFLTAGRPRPGLGQAPKNLLAMASWRPYPLPGGAAIPIGLRCERLWLLLQNYVHPMKNYLPNGEVVLCYAGGERVVESLVPPYNLDCYFQHFSRKGVAVPFGRLGPWPTGWTPIHRGLADAHADALEIACDPARALESVEVRATCSEGVLGIAGMTALAAEQGE